MSKLAEYDKTVIFVIRLKTIISNEFFFETKTNRIKNENLKTCIDIIMNFFISLGIFKNKQSQVDEYLNALNPLLRRTTEGKLSLILIKECLHQK